MVKAPGWQSSIDGGEGRMLLDVAGQPLWHQDAEGREFRTVYDVLRRPTEQWCGASLLGLSVYGEGQPNDSTLNLRGQVIRMYDGAGKHYVDAFDFKGQPVKSYMRLLSDAQLADADWESLDDNDLSDEVFFREVVSDALGRPLTADSGRIRSGVTEHNITTHTYEKDGALKTVQVSGDSYVQDIHHNAKGQREAIWYGNGTKTSYSYDALSQRLNRLLTIRLSDNQKLQDLNYFYDPAGNITIIRDDAQEDVFFSGTVVSPDNDYCYDALYRLIEAHGREQKASAVFGSGDNSGDGDAFASSTTPWDGSSTTLQQYMSFLKNYTPPLSLRRSMQD